MAPWRAGTEANCRPPHLCPAHDAPGGRRRANQPPYNALWPDPRIHAEVLGTGIVADLGSLTQLSRNRLKDNLHPPDEWWYGQMGL
jgi:hypothetical protein